MEGPSTTVKFRQRTFEMIVDLTGKDALPPDYADWPNNIKDGVEAAIERVKARVNGPVIIEEWHSDVDDGTPYVYIKLSAVEALQ